MAVERVGVLKHLRLCVVFAGSLACVQSLVWMILALIGLIFYSDCSPPTSANFADNFGTVLRMMYFLDDACTGGGAGMDREEIGFTDSHQMLIWTSVYLVISIFWLVSSLLLVKYVRWERVTSALPYLYVWCTFTLVMSVLDLVLGLLLGVDMYLISAYADSFAALAPDVLWLLTLMRTASGIMMTLVLRGYVLWIVNVCSAGYLAACTVQIYKGLHTVGNYQQSNTLTRGPITAYDSTIEARSSLWLEASGGLDRPHLKQQANLNRSNSKYSGDVSPNRYLGEGNPGRYAGEINPAFAHSNNNVNRAAGKPTIAPKPTAWQRPSPTQHAPEPKPMPWERPSPIQHLPEPKPMPRERPSPTQHAPEPKPMPWERPSPIQHPPEPKPKPWERSSSTQQAPYTPSPDYSPPSARAARSALKPVYSSLYKR